MLILPKCSNPIRSMHSTWTDFIIAFCCLLNPEWYIYISMKNSSIHARLKMHPSPFPKKERKSRRASITLYACYCVVRCFAALPKQKINFNYFLRKPTERSLGLSALLDWCLILLYKLNYGTVRLLNLLGWKLKKEGKLQQDHHHKNAKQMCQTNLQL